VRGHLCPSAERKASAHANDETFVMTNVHPQVRELNGGPWERMEQYERKLAERGKVVFLVAGGLFDDPAPTLRGGISVPRASFKVLISLEPGQDAATITRANRSYAVIMPNVPAVGGTPWTSHLTTIDEVERQSGYDVPVQRRRNSINHSATILRPRFVAPPRNMLDIRRRRASRERRLVTA
jgi:endonuclease G